ncbi:tRNA-specific adenosine deaminase [Wolbachia pipientis]|uniref:tRNA-specific adenosine deaminase n=2 Tax=Wolbachia pipientis TaxID=955 RepID=A0A1E7QJC3_WOLPI|nr:tRNA-specific adenosine deaminase [Wolbachia pipientis]
MFDYHYMQLAIKQAEIAYKNNEVPVGAVIVLSGKIIASTYNMTITLGDPTAHAEMLAIRKGLELCYNAEMYVTLEPCPMCAQAIAFAKIKRLYFGAYNPQGNIKTFIPEIYGGILESKCSFLLKDFFKELRNE